MINRDDRVLTNVCPVCGGMLCYDDLKIDYVICDSCGWEGDIDEADITQEDLDEYKAEYKAIYGENDDDMPEACVGCGNGNYPDCMDGCTLFDD